METRDPRGPATPHLPGPLLVGRRAVVTGGAESALGGLSRAAFAAMGATSESGISRPFDVMEKKPPPP